MGKFLSEAETALALISQFGSAVSIERAGGGEYDPVEGVLEDQAVSTMAFQAVLLPPASARKLGVDLAERRAVEVYFALLGASGIPQPGDTLVAGGVRYALFWTQTYDPAGDGPIMTIAFAEQKG